MFFSFIARGLIDRHDKDKAERSNYSVIYTCWESAKKKKKMSNKLRLHTDWRLPWIGLRWMRRALTKPSTAVCLVIQKPAKQTRQRSINQRQNCCFLLPLSQNLQLHGSHCYVAAVDKVSLCMLLWALTFFFFYDELQASGTGGEGSAFYI